MKLDRVMEQLDARKRLKRLEQLCRLRDSVGHGNQWLDLEISEIETFLKEKEETV